MGLMRLELNDLNDNIPPNVYAQRGISGNVIMGMFPAHFGDIEVAFACKDGNHIAAILEQSLQQCSDSLASRELIYRFKNLDGGADAAFQVSSVGESVRVILERSDEGALEFRLSPNDTKRFADFLKSVCSAPSNPQAHTP
jgi:hypothetical protein